MTIHSSLRIAAVSVLASLSVLACSTPVNAPAPPVSNAQSCRINNAKDYVDFPECFVPQKDGSMKVKPEILEQIDFKNSPHAPHVSYSDFTRRQPENFTGSKVVMGYILPSGRAHDVIFFDNGPDYFENGLARFVSKDGKIGFIDKKLRVAIPPTHDFVAPFREGRAYFCDGCKLENTPGDGHPDDHHASVRGGQWGVMDAKGRTVRGPMPEKELFPERK